MDAVLNLQEGANYPASHRSPNLAASLSQRGIRVLGFGFPPPPITPPVLVCALQLPPGIHHGSSVLLHGRE